MDERFLDHDSIADEQKIRELARVIAHIMVEDYSKEISGAGSKDRVDNESSNIRQIQ